MIIEVSIVNYVVESTIKETNIEVELSTIELDSKTNDIILNAEVLGYANAGQSAYEIWLGEGNTGTKQDFLDSLVVVNDVQVDNETIELNNNKLSIKNKSNAEDNGIFMKRDNEFVFKATLDGGLF